MYATQDICRAFKSVIDGVPTIKISYIHGGLLTYASGVGNVNVYSFYDKTVLVGDEFDSNSQRTGNRVKLVFDTSGEMTKSTISGLLNVDNWSITGLRYPQTEKYMADIDENNLISLYPLFENYAKIDLGTIDSALSPVYDAAMLNDRVFMYLSTGQDISADAVCVASVDGGVKTYLLEDSYNSVSKLVPIPVKGSR